MYVRMCSGLDAAEEKLSTIDEDRERDKKILNEERIKKVEAINKLAQVSRWMTLA